jgi:putative thioredoxin
MTVHEVTDAEFTDAVIARSHEIAVLVDFWAPWCGPCRMLSPVLEKLSTAYKDRVEMVKLDTDANPAAAQQFRVTSIPAVKLFKNGAVVAEFVGAQPEARIRAFLDEHAPSAAAKHAGVAQELLDNGDIDGAADAAATSLKVEPGQPRALLVDALVKLRRGQLDAAARSAAAIAVSAAEWEAGQALLQVIELARPGAAAGGLESLRTRVAAQPDDLDARYALAGSLAAVAEYRGALEQLLAIVERDRKWHDEAARKAMLALFALLGVRHATSDEYRRKLAVLL